MCAQKKERHVLLLQLRPLRGGQIATGSPKKKDRGIFPRNLLPQGLLTKGQVLLYKNTSKASQAGKRGPFAQGMTYLFSKEVVQMEVQMGGGLEEMKGVPQRNRPQKTFRLRC